MDNKDYLPLSVESITEEALRKQEEKLNKFPADSKLRYMLDLPAILPHELDMLLDDNDIMLEAARAAQTMGLLDDCVMYLTKIQDNLSLLAYHHEIYTAAAKATHTDRKMATTTSAHAQYLSRQCKRAAAFVDIMKVYELPKDIVNAYAHSVQQLSQFSKS